jgi:lysophospholipase L1-like esterase
MAKIPGTAVASPIVPLDSGLPTPTHVDTYGKGGWVTVASLAERNAIPPERRKPGMVAAVADAPGSTPWELATDLVTWMPFRPPSFPNAEIFTNTSLAVAGTTAGDWFYVADETGKSLYRNVAGVATFVILEASAAQLTAATEAAATNAALAVAAKEAAEEAADRVDLGALDAAVAATEADAVQTADDRVQTAADRVQTGLDRAQTAADVLETAANVALSEAAADNAFVNADVYDDTATGLAAVADGDQFQVVGASGLEIIRYRRDAGPVAAEVSRYPSALAVERRRETGLINGWPDPFFRHFDYSNVSQFGFVRYRFASGGTGFTLVGNTQFDGNALRRTANVGVQTSGPHIDLGDLGADEGETITVTYVVQPSATADIFFPGAFTNGNPQTLVGPQVMSGASEISGLSVVKRTTVVPAGAFGLALYPYTSDAGITFDILALYVTKGDVDQAPAWPNFDDAEYLSLRDRFAAERSFATEKITGKVNGWADPFFRYFALDTAAQFGRARYFFGSPGAPTLALVPNAVYDGQALRKTGNSDLSGPRIWFDDVGVVEGDSLTIRGLVIGNGEVVDWLGRWLDASGTVVGVQIGGVANPGGRVTASATPTTATMTGVVPAGAVGVRMYPVTASGGDGVFDIVAVWAYRGEPDVGPESPAFDDGAYLSLIDADQQDQINALSAIAVELQRETGVINGWPDPFFRHFSLANTEQLGRERYFFGTIGAPTLTLVPNTVYDGQALRKTGNTDLSGPRIWLDDIGVAEGDTLTVRGLIVGNGELVDWIGRWLDVSGALIGTQIGSAFTASATPSLATMSGVAPAGAVSFRMYPITASGGDGTFDIAAVWAYRGNSNDGPTVPAFDDSAYLALVDADQQQQLDALGGPELPRENSAAWGNWNLRSYRAQRAKISGGAGELIVAVIGDSWVNTAFRIYGPLRDYLDSQMGVSAPGYVSANIDIDTAAGATRIRSGAWTDVRVEPGVFGPDTTHATTTDPAATLSYSAAAVSRYVIHYVTTPDGGTFSYALGAGTPVDVDTDAAAGHQTIEVTGAADEQLNLAILSAGGSGVTITGVDIRNDTPGQAVVHKLGNGGATALRFESVPAGNLTAAYSALAPHLAIILLGTNDNSQNVTLEAFKTRIKNVADRIIAGSPRCDILLVGPGPNDLVRTFEIDDYNDQLFALARENGWAFIDLKRFFGEFVDADARGLYGDGVHPNADGGRVIRSAIIDSHLTVSE